MFVMDTGKVGYKCLLSFINSRGVYIISYTSLPIHKRGWMCERWTDQMRTSVPSTLCPLPSTTPPMRSVPWPNRNTLAQYQLLPTQRHSQHLPEVQLGDTTLSKSRSSHTQLIPFLTPGSQSRHAGGSRIPSLPPPYSHLAHARGSHAATRKLPVRR